MNWPAVFYVSPCKGNVHDILMHEFAHREFWIPSQVKTEKKFANSLLFVISTISTYLNDGCGEFKRQMDSADRPMDSELLKIGSISRLIYMKKFIWYSNLWDMFSFQLSPSIPAICFLLRTNETINKYKRRKDKKEEKKKRQGIKNSKSQNAFNLKCHFP